MTGLRQSLPLDIHVPAELIGDPPSVLAALLSAKAQEWGLQPDGTIPSRVEPDDITHADVTADRLQRGGPDLHRSLHDDRGELRHRILEINWATTGNDP